MSEPAKTVTHHLPGGWLLLVAQLGACWRLQLIDPKGRTLTRDTPVPEERSMLRALADALDPHQFEVPLQAPSGQAPRPVRICPDHLGPVSGDSQGEKDAPTLKRSPVSRGLGIDTDG